MYVDNGEPLPLWSFYNFNKFSEIINFTTTRYGGISQGNYAALNLGYNAQDKRTRVAANRRLLARRLHIVPEHFVFPHQTHSNNVFCISDCFHIYKAKRNMLYNVDALITDIPNLCISVLTADCVPVLLFDPVEKVIGAIHAGWRGTVAEISHRTVESMHNHFGCKPSNIIAGIGPAIGPECYEVGQEVVAEAVKVASVYNNIIEASGKVYLNLPYANQMQLMLSGCSKNNIEMANVCTYCNSDLFFSARYSKDDFGRFATGIMIIL